MKADNRQIKLSISVRRYGYWEGAWRHAGVRPGWLLDIDFHIDLARTAERGLFDMYFVADGLGLTRPDGPVEAFGRENKDIELEPITLLSALAPITKNIGLVATVSTTFMEPYHIARIFASLDHISRGRTGWNVVTSYKDVEGQNFGRDGMKDKAVRYERANEAVEVVSGLWDSWDDGAFVRNQETGVYFDPAKIKPLNHIGKYYKVAGPLIVPPTPQGRPIIVQAGASDAGQEMAARSADVVYAANNSLDQAKAAYASIKSRMAKYGRHPDELKFMPGLLVITGETDAEAQTKYKAMQDALDPTMGKAILANVFGDISKYDLDEPVPKDMRPDPNVSRAAVMHQVGLRNKLTLRQLYQQVLIGNGHNVVVGSPKTVVDTMERWFVEKGADGFNFLPAVSPYSLREFVELVVPELQRRGLFRTAYEGSTLRESLGLPWPEGRILATAQAG